MRTVEIKDIDELYEELADTKLRIALTRIMMEDANTLQNEIDDDPELQQMADRHYVRTKDHIHRLIDRELRKKRLKHMVHHSLPKAGRVAAAALLIFFIGLSTAIAVSSTVRVRVMELIIRIEERYTELSLEENPEASFDVPADWLASYYPTYIPEGYRLIEVFGTARNSRAEFKNDVGYRIIFTENDEYGMSNIDTEGAKVGQKAVNGKQVMTVEKNGIAVLVWADFDSYYTLWVDAGIDLACQITEGLTRIN